MSGSQHRNMTLLMQAVRMDEMVNGKLLLRIDYKYIVFMPRRSKIGAFFISGMLQEESSIKYVL